MWAKRDFDARAGNKHFEDTPALLTLFEILQRSQEMVLFFCLSRAQQQYIIECIERRAQRQQTKEKWK